MFYKSVENMVIKQIVITTEKNRRNAMNYFKNLKYWKSTDKTPYIACE